MNSYALDINNLKVIDAMNALALQKDELMQKKLEDFAGPRISKEVQQLRYEYHNKKVQDSIKRIKQYIKENRYHKIGSARILSSDVSARTHRGIMYAESSRPTSENMFDVEDKLEKIKSKHKNIILKKLEHLQKTEQTDMILKQKSSRGKTVEQTLKQKLEVQKTKKNKVKELQTKNALDIKTENDESQKIMKMKISKSLQDFQDRGKQKDEKMRRKTKAKEEQFRKKQEEIRKYKEEREIELEKEIGDKLQGIQFKIEKSKEIHEQEIKKRIEKAQKFIDRVGIISKYQEKAKETNEIESLKRIIDKHSTVEDRKFQIEQMKQEEIEKKRKKFEEKREGANTKIKETEIEHQSKTLFLEKRIATSEKIMKQKKEDWNKELELRQELQRLREEDKKTKVDRAKRLFSKKREIMLEKQLQNQQRIESYKKEKELLKDKARETCLKAMVEREKVAEVLSLLLKSPGSKVTNEKLKFMNIIANETDQIKEAN